jgi:hypothetical protein
MIISNLTDNQRTRDHNFDAQRRQKRLRQLRGAEPRRGRGPCSGRQPVSSSRKAAIRSAINTASRWFNLPATAIPAHPEFLRRLFLPAFRRTAVGATPKRVSNVKSDLLFALRHLRLLARGSYLAPLAPEWQALWNRLPDK